MSGLIMLILTPLASSFPHYYYTNTPSVVHSPIYKSYSHNPSAYSSSVRNLQVPSNLGYRPAFGLGPVKNIIKQTRTQAESIKTTLRHLASTPGSAKYLKRVITDNNNVCLNSVEDAIASVEASTRIIENAGPEITQLIQTVQAFEKLTDTPTVVRESANILRLLEVLIPKLAPASPSSCGATNDQVFGSLRSLAALVDELSSSSNLFLIQEKRQQLKRSGGIITRVTNFLTELNKSFLKLDQFCTSDKEYNIESIAAIGEMMTSLSGLFGELGGVKDAEQIKKQGDFTKRVVANISKLGDLDLGTLECKNSGSFKVAAQALDDIANLIEEVGIEKLCQQLGLAQADCSF